MTLRNAFADLAIEPTQQAILAELAQKLEPGQAVALDAATLTALETVTAVISSIPAVDLSPATLAALETINAAISGSVSISNFPATQEVSGTVGLDAAALAALEDITVSIPDQVQVFGPLSDTQLRASPVPVTTGLSQPITDAQARATPLPVSVAAGTVEVSNIAALAVLNAISVNAYDLQVAPYTGVTAITQDYMLSRLEAEFSTATTRTITVRTQVGVVLWTQEVTALDVSVDFGNLSFDAGDQITVTVTQTDAPCTMDLRLVVQAGSSMLGGNPSLGESGAKIGKVDIDVAAGPSGDAFGRLRVTSPFTLLDAQHQYNESPLFMADWASGGGITHLPNESGVQLTSNGTAGNYCRWQSRRYMRYQPGKSQLIIMTGALGTPEAGVRRRMGYFDNEDGLFVEQDGLNGVFFVRRTSTSGVPVDNRIAQVDWNGDKFDGSGPSGAIFDPSKMQLFMIDFEWLSIGRVRFWFDIGGRPWLAHQITLANTITTPYMKTANLPIRYEVAHTATTGTPASLKAICQTVMTEGGQDQTGISHTASTGAIATSVAGLDIPVIAVRKKLTFNGLVNRALCSLMELQVLSDQALYWELVLDPVLTGASWTSVAVNSVMEQDISSTAMAGGEVIAAGYAPGGQRGGVTQAAIDLEQFVFALSPDGSQSSVIGLRVSRLGSNTNCYAAIVLREEY